ncbi:MAG: hypothetical protein FWE06_07460 [Oscillospiraceae bacterium]|nr:hypothetical protein [Oscillospiraceae bacterium]
MTFGRVKLSAGFVLLWSLLYFFDTGGWLPLVAFAALVHELGHWLAMRVFGKRVSQLSFGIGGINMTMSNTPLIDWKTDIFITLAGPLASVVLACAAYFYGSWRLAGVSVVLSVVNLLPAATLDGGRALMILGRKMWGERGETMVATSGTVLCLAVMLTVGVWIAMTTNGRNLTLVAMTVPLLWGMGRKQPEGMA